MKPHIKNTLKLTFAILFSFLFVNCSSEIPQLNVLVAQDFMRNVTIVKFSESADPSNSLSPYDKLNNTKITVDGPDAKDVYDMSGYKNFIIQSGSIGLLLDPRKDFTDKESYTVNLNFEKPGYLSRIIPVRFYKEKPDGLVLVNLVKIPTKLVLGVDANINEGTAAIIQKTGIIDPTIGLKIPIEIIADPNDNPNANNFTSATATIPAGVKMKDENGNLLSGKLTVTLASFSEEGSSTAYFPGSLFPEEVIMEGGTIKSGGFFVSAGFMLLEMSVNGVPVTNFSTPIDIKINISKNAINPISKKLFKTGDTIDAWSYNQTNGKWSFQTNGIVSGSGSNLYVAFTTTHLSYFSLAFFQDSSGICENNSILKINWSGTDSKTPVDCRLKFSFVDGNNGTWDQLYQTTDEFLYDGKEIEILNVPKRPLQVEIYDKVNQKQLGIYSFGENGLCTATSITINTTPPDPGTLVTCSYTAKCPQGYDVLPPVGTTVYFKLNGGTSDYALLYTVTTENRNSLNFVTNRLIIGQTYDFLTYTGGVLAPQKQTHKIELNYNNATEFHLDFILPTGICK
jgi:hypothetical protein